MSDKFDLHATMAAIGQAALAVLCHILFDFALHGLGMACLLAIAGSILRGKGRRFGQPLLRVARRVALVCGLLSLPGAISLAIFGKLPDAGVFNINSIGFICAWTLICLHLSAEEINHSLTSS